MKTRIIPAMHVALKPSYEILGCYVLVSMFSLISLIQATLPLLLKYMIAFAVIIATIYVILQDVLLRLPWSWKLVEVTSQGKVRIHNQCGDTFEVVLLSSTVCHPWLTILCFKRFSYRHGLRTSLMLTVWQVQDQQQYRKLRVWLNWSKADAKHQPLDALTE
jgi:hypothetical protein